MALCWKGPRLCQKCFPDGWIAFREHTHTHERTCSWPQSGEQDSHPFGSESFSTRYPDTLREAHFQVAPAVAKQTTGRACGCRVENPDRCLQLSGADYLPWKENAGRAFSGNYSEVTDSVDTVDWGGKKKKNGFQPKRLNWSQVRSERPKGGRIGSCDKLNWVHDCFQTAFNYFTGLEATQSKVTKYRDVHNESIID